MLDQTFSAKNFMNVYSQENRMGRIPVETMGENFKAVIAMIKETNSELQKFRSRKKAEKTDEVKKKIEELKQEQKDLKADKQKALFEEMQDLSSNVNSSAFRFKLEKRRNICADNVEWSSGFQQQLDVRHDKVTIGLLDLERFL